MSSRAEIYDQELDTRVYEPQMTGPLYKLSVPHPLIGSGRKYYDICVIGNFNDDPDKSRYQQVLEVFPVDDEFIMRRLRPEQIARIAELTGEAVLKGGGLMARSYMRQEADLA